MNFRLSSAVLLLAALCSACAGSDDSAEAERASGARASHQATQASPAPSPTEQPSRGVCAVLDVATVEQLAGQALKPRKSTVAGSDLPACLYGSLDDVGLQVARAPATDWARALPTLVRQLKSADALRDPATSRQLEQAARLIAQGRTVKPEHACDLFNRMLQATGGPANADTVVNYLPNKQDPQAVTGQRCDERTFTSILLARPTSRPATSRPRRPRTRSTRSPEPGRARALPETASRVSAADAHRDLESDYF